MKDWKSTAAGILSFIIATLMVITGWLATYMITAPASTQATLTKYGAILTLATALARAWIGIITNNADATATAQAITAVAPVNGLPTPTPASIATTPKIVSMILLCLFIGMAVTGCSSFERNTFNSLAASQAVINQAQTDYTSGTIKETSCTYAVINDAKAAQTVAVNAMIVYETEKNAGSSLSAQTVAITADLAAIVPLVAEVKILYTNPSSCVLPKGN